MAASPTADHLHGVAEQVLHLGGDGLDPVRELAASAAGVLEEPAAQLTFLRPGQADDVVLAAGPPLDQGERLQHGVVQVRGDLGPLRLPDPAGPLGLQVPPELQRPRQQHQHHAAQDGHGGQQREPRLFPGARARTPSPGHRQPPAPGRPPAGAHPPAWSALVLSTSPARRVSSSCIQAIEAPPRTAAAGISVPREHVHAQQLGNHDAGDQQQSAAQQDFLAVAHSPAPGTRVGLGGRTCAGRRTKPAAPAGLPSSAVVAAAGRLTAGAMGDAGRRALRRAASSAVGTMIQSHA